MKNGMTDAASLLHPSFRFCFDVYFDDLIRRAVQDPAQSAEGDHGDVPSLFQRVQRSVVNAALEQLILRHALLRHGPP